MNIAKAVLIGGIVLGLMAMGLSFVVPMGYIILIGFLGLLAGILPYLGVFIYRKTAPTAFKYADAKMEGKKVLWVFREDRTISPELVTFDSGKFLLASGLPVIIDSPDDIYMLDGVPTAIMFRPVGKTLDPEKLLTLRELEHLGYDRKSFKTEMERIAFQDAFNERYNDLIRQGVSNEKAREMAVMYAKTEMTNANRMPRLLKILIGKDGKRRVKND